MVLEVKNVNYAYKSQKGKEILKKGERNNRKSVDQRYKQDNLKIIWFKLFQ